MIRRAACAVTLMVLAVACSTQPETAAGPAAPATPEVTAGQQAADAALSAAEEGLAGGVGRIPDDPETEGAPISTAEVVATSEEPTTIDTFAENGMEQAVEAIAAKVGGDSLALTQIVFYDGYVIANAPDPAAPEEVNRWTFMRGSMQESNPIGVPDPEKLADSVFDVHDVDLAVVAEVATKAEADADIEAGTLTHIIVERRLPFSTDVEIFAYVTSIRENAVVKYSLTGKLLDVA